MKEFLFIVSFLLIGRNAFLQEPALSQEIDSFVAQNERKVATIYQKTETNKLKASHGKNPDFISKIYRFNSNRNLFSAATVLFSVNDTMLIINYYFDSVQLIKVKTIDSQIDNKPTVDVFYYSRSQIINKEYEAKGPYPPEYYLKQASRLLKNLKKRPIKFPEYRNERD
jgi:hypothetical protein